MGKGYMGCTSQDTEGQRFWSTAPQAAFIALLLKQPKEDDMQPREVSMLLKHSPAGDAPCSLVPALKGTAFPLLHIYDAIHLKTWYTQVL